MAHNATPRSLQRSALTADGDEAHDRGPVNHLVRPTRDFLVTRGPSQRPS